MRHAVSPASFTYQDITDISFSVRKKDGNKGTFGKVLVVAGSRTIGGAAILAAEAALRSGCGMVRVFTEKTNRDAVLAALPESLIDVYDDTSGRNLPDVLKRLSEAVSWSDAVVCGCGIGTGDTARALLERLLTERQKPLVLDADALNLLSLPENGLQEKAAQYADEAVYRPLVLTPHAGEFARLYRCAFETDVTVEDCKANAAKYPDLLAKKMRCIVLYKDAKSVVTNGTEPYYVNESGNDGMATAGSGDVLAGLLGALLAMERGKDAFKTVCKGTFCHGLAGDLAAERHGKRAMIASDLATALRDVLRMIDDRGAEGGFVAKRIK